ncbi:MAG: hypothetical protein PHU53_05790, partial [Thermoplasmata archaeon]|nr:hypothetical protein [Thermoplasmata archaeon]
WGGDRFHYYQSNGDFLCVWKIEWDTEADCQEFTVAFNKMVSLLPQGQRDEFTSGYARMDSDGTGATFYRASDPALISAIIP